MTAEAAVWGIILGVWMVVAGLRGLLAADTPDPGD